MNKLVSIVLMLLFISSSIICRADVVVFRTYEDFKNQKGEVYEGYEYATSFHKVGKWSCIFKKKGSENLVLKGKEVWGFEYKEHLIRHDLKTTIPYVVISINKIVYYENGHAVLDMLKNDTKNGTYSVGESHLFSVDLNSELAKLETIIFGKENSKQNSFSGNFKIKDETSMEHPEFKPLYICLKPNRWSIDLIRKCVAEFNK